MDSAIKTMVLGGGGHGRPHQSQQPLLRHPGGVLHARRRRAGGVPAAPHHPPADIYTSLQNYVIVDGDRLDNLAAKFLGDPCLYLDDLRRRRRHDPDELTAQVEAPSKSLWLRGFPRERGMGSPLYLTLMVGPVEAVPAPKPLMDALTGVEVNVSATSKSGFQLSFTLANSSPLQLFFLLSMGAPVPIIRLILVATFGGLPQVIMDGIVKHTEVVPDAMQGSSKLVITGEDLSAVMDLEDFSGIPYPGMTPDLRVLTILGKYAMFGIVPNVVPVITPDVKCRR